jgi:hypothetical protein
MDLSPEVLARLESIAACGIQFLPVPQLGRFFVFERDGFVALVENRAGAFGDVGSPGRLTDRGFEVLVEREGRKFFIAKGYEEEATPEQAEKLYSFFTDLQRALR